VNPKVQPEARLTTVRLRQSPGAPLKAAARFPSRAFDDLKPTTSVLTATTLTYAIRAGITVFFLLPPPTPHPPHPRARKNKKSGSDSLLALGPRLPLFQQPAFTGDGLYLMQKILRKQSSCPSRDQNFHPQFTPAHRHLVSELHPYGEQIPMEPTCCSHYLQVHVDHHFGQSELLGNCEE
jgi:hypothetical protein